MASPAKHASVDPADLAGDLAPLVEQLGSPGAAAAPGVLAALLNCPCVENAVSLGVFLDAYCARVLGPVELPAIARAWRHASRFEARELIALDRVLAAEPLLQPFARASRHAGRDQLRRLRPLRDQKLVRRYQEAIDAGEAAGWHTLVYGLTLAVYSLPPRQGLLVYARQTLQGFAHGAAGRLKLSETGLASAVDNACAALPTVVNALLVDESTPFRPGAVEPVAARA